MPLYGGIEAGGTKFVCVIASGPDDIQAEERFATTTPQETLAKTVDFFTRHRNPDNPFLSIGIACFGPIDLNPHSPTFGYITTTPKPNWQNTNVKSTLQHALGVPVAMDTDVNAAAVGEGVWGQGIGLSDYVYFTIGTGIGGGAISNGKPIHGLVHEEMGHMRLPHDWASDPYGGFCLYHGDCFEGLACGPSIQQRWELSAELLPVDHGGWDLEAHYISLALNNVLCILSPQRIILGGGVMQQLHLFPKVRHKLKESLNGYIAVKEIRDDIDHYVVPPGLGSRGILIV
jgi:fructokinase